MRSSTHQVRRRIAFGGAVFALAAMIAISYAKAESSAEKPTQKIVSLHLLPESLTLNGARDVQHVLVLGETEAHQRVDLSSTATFKPTSDLVSVSAAGAVKPLKQGEVEVTVTAAGLTAKLPVTVKSAATAEVGFVRDVEPIMARIGCNAGTCHGSAKGKEGFKLSLRGYDPDYDYQALVNDLSGRRFNRVNVDDSLMLLKPTAEVPHEGRQVLKLDSRYYRLIRDW